MKRIEKGSEPTGLTAFRLANPTATWDDFKNNAGDQYSLLVDEMSGRQQGLCAYCEMAFTMKHDWSVDHFHPKSDHHGFSFR